MSVESDISSDDNYIEDWEIGIKNNFVGIGWRWVGDLRKFNKNEKNRLIEKLKSHYESLPDGKYKRGDHIATERSFSNWAGEILRFVHEIKIGDFVILPTFPEDTNDIIYHIGKIKSGVYYEEKAKDGAYVDSRRNVSWLKIISKKEISERLVSSLSGSPKPTVYNIDKHSKEIQSILHDKAYSEPKLEISEEDMTEKYDLIKKRFLNLSPTDFEHFVAHILECGFSNLEGKIKVTKSTGDCGIDFICTNEKGCITFRGQVKRVTRNISNSEILQLRGALLDGEKGIFVTTSVFTESAKKEAKAEGKKPIVLIDGLLLSHIILEIYDKLDDKYKKILNIEKK